jgi:two-component system alkaline phosphatase synthesis response regulator PhoP
MNGIRLPFSVLNTAPEQIMIRALIIAKDADSKTELRTALAHYNLAPSFTSYSNGFRQAVTSEKPEIILLETGEHLPSPETWELIRRLKKERKLPVIALIQRDMLENINQNPDIDDFLAAPYDSNELILRINRLLLPSHPDIAQPIKGRGLVIDPDTCEVMVEGSKVELTFKEYELLKLLASNKGRVFTREALLDKIWGYDYYGGDRTVDVHIRRLRSKIEYSRAYIETVRNIGYRFVKDE